MPQLCEWYIQAFWDLSTERQVGMALGPIPMSKVEELADRFCLTEENTDTLKRSVRAMDKEFLAWSAAQAQAEREKN